MIKYSCNECYSKWLINAGKRFACFAGVAYRGISAATGLSIKHIAQSNLPPRSKTIAILSTPVVLVGGFVFNNWIGENPQGFNSQSTGSGSDPGSSSTKGQYDLF